MPQDIIISNATVHYHGKPLFINLTLTLKAGCCTSLLGQSGIGKSSLLRLIAKQKRSVGYLPQKNSLMPWLSALDNVMLGSRLRHEKRDLKKAQALLHELGLGAHLQKKPSTLSGGQQQRVALARLLYEAPDLILMDEPLSALDAITRFQMQNILAEKLKNKTCLLVTHDPLEALRLSEHIYIMRGTPATLLPFAALATSPPRDVHDHILQKRYADLLTELAAEQEVTW